MMTGRRWLLLLVLPLLFSATLGASPLTYLFPSRVMDKPIDFKHLDFECSREEDHAPKPTPEAEALFQKAYQTNLQQQGTGHGFISLDAKIVAYPPLPC